MGVGTNNPLEMMQVEGAIKIGTDFNNSNAAPTGGAGTIRWNGTNFQGWDGSQWIDFTGSGSAGWELTGNAGTTSGTDFLGTTDNTDFRIRTNNIERFTIENGTDPLRTRVGIGTNTVSTQTIFQAGLEIAGNVPNLILNDQTGGAQDDFTILNGGGTANILNGTTSSNIMTFGLANYSNNVGIGTTTPSNRLHVEGNIRMVDGNQQTGYVAVSDVNGTMTWTDPTTINVAPNELADADNDTKVQVEETADEDIIRFDVAGTETWRMIDDRLESTNTKHSVYIGENAGTSELNAPTRRSVFVGESAGQYNANGNNNVAIGYQSQMDRTSGNMNVAVGSKTLRTNTGSNNTVIGHLAGQNSGSGSGNIFIGHSAGHNETGDNKLYIENSNTSDPLIYGEFDNDIVGINGSLGVGTEAPSEKLAVWNGDFIIGGNQNIVSRGMTIYGARQGTSSTVWNNLTQGHSYINFDNYDGDNSATRYTSAIITSVNAPASDDGDLRFFTTSDQTPTEAMRITYDGNVGIGDHPTDKLHVAGNIRMVDGNQATGYIPVSDANGTMTWTDPSAISGVNELVDNDNDTKVQVEASSDEDKIRLQTGGIHRMTVDEDGHVGIGGNLDPRYPLDINNPLNAMLSSSTVDVSELSMRVRNGSTAVGQGSGIGFATGGPNLVGAAIVHERLGTNSLGSLHFATKSDQGVATDLPIRMTIRNSGDVGVGTTSPSSKFHVAGTTTVGDPSSTSPAFFNLVRSGSAGRLFLGSGGASPDLIVQAETTGGDIRMHTNSGEIMRIRDNGRVGIGTTTPGEELEVQGSIRMVDGNQTAGYVPVSDANGTMTWTDPSTLEDNNTLDEAYDEGGAGTGRVIDATDGAVRINGDDGLIVTGTLGNGDAVEVTGAGTRMFFNPNKGAFRAGTSFSTYWDDPAVGVNSFAAGNATLASGPYSTAFGNNAYATGSLSFAAGDNVEAGRSYSSVFGSNLQTYSGYEFVVGRWNTNYGADSQNGWDPDDRLFVVGNGTSSAARSNALTVMKDGNVGIGDDDPATALHVVPTLAAGPTATFETGSTTYPGAAVKITPSTHATSNRASIQLDDWHLVQDRTGNGTKDLSLWQESSTEHRLLINTAGNVGIGDVTPDAKLDIEGSIQMVDGNQAAGYIPVSDANGTMTWTDPTSISDGDWTISGNDQYSAVSGNVGVGTNSPDAKLDVVGEQFNLRQTANFTGVIMNLRGNRHNGVSLNPWNHPTTGFATLNFKNRDASDSNTEYVGARITSVNEGSSDDGDLRFYTTSDLTEAEAMRISMDGNVGIGAVAQDKLHVVGNIRMVDGNQAAGYIPVSNANGTMTWTDPTTISTSDDGDWTVNGNDQYSAVSGNVGIGVTTPVEKLAVWNGDAIIGGNQNGRDRGITLYGARNGTSNTSWNLLTRGHAFIDFDNYDGGNSATQYTSAVITSVNNPGTDDGDLRFLTASDQVLTEAMRITYDGNVGIGAHPSVKFHVLGNTSVQNGTLRLQSNDTYEKIQLTDAGTNGSKINHSAGWSIDHYAGPGNANTLGQHRFFTTDNGYSEKLRIASDGNVGIGLTNPGAKLDVAGDVDVNEHALKFTDPQNSNTVIEITGNDPSFPDEGVAVRALTNPPGGEPIFRVLSQGGAERLRVEHSGAVAMDNTIRIAGGNPGAGKVLTATDNSGNATWQEVGVPSGAVMFFNLPACPTGWSDLAAAQGRYIVGQLPGGNLGATVGSALSNQENRATGAHTHTVNPPSTSTSTNGNHNHDFYTAHNDVNNSGSQGYPAGNNHRAMRTSDRRQRTEDNGTIRNAGNHSHTVDIPQFNSGSTGVAGTNAPYLQLRVCQKD